MLLHKRSSPNIKQISLNVFILMFLVSKLFNLIQPIKATKMFKSVCLGGTFDGIHAGHELLFDEALKICSERLVVGVTNTNMIKKKILWELITPLDDRIKNVKDYLVGQNPNLTYHVVPLNDLYGPTIVEKDLECIVVSEETVRGANKINEARKDLGWPLLDIKIVNLLQDNNTLNEDAKSRLNEKKVSSSLMRLDKLGTIIRPPQPNDSIPKRPYIIGLTGGVASGKSSIGKYLESDLPKEFPNLGIRFAHISCDLLAHKTYEKEGSPVYKQIVDYFGDSILTENRQIDRNILGKIVFADKEKMEKLQDFVWPAMFVIVDEQIEQLKRQYDVIVLESAILNESNQTKRVHQVWTTIVSPEEAIKRIESRGKTKEFAEKVISSQVDNFTRIQRTNVVFCTSWEPKFTQQQVLKSVNELKEKYLEKQDQ